jgi:hypothetical protein
MTLLEEAGTQADMAAHALSDLARSAVEKAPNVVEGAHDELGRDVPRAFGRARELVEQIAAGVQERIAIDEPSGPLPKLASHGVAGTVPSIEDGRRCTNAGIRQAHGIAKHARRRGQGTPMKSSEHTWRRRVTLIVFGLAVGVIVNRALRTRHRSEAVGAPASSTVRHSPQSRCTPYHTVVSDSGGGGGVYHDREDCPAGRRILPERRVSGTGGRDRCKDCQKLAS